MSLPSITRKTDQGLPTYDDDTESDVFILSGAEDLVPTLTSDGIPERHPRILENEKYEVIRYRPRIEGLYARIERWTAASNGETHWRSISRDNVTTVYGNNPNSRIADPADPVHRIFTWLIHESFDDKGNAIAYHYAEENDTEVDLAAAHEQHRPNQARGTNRYLKSVTYGNRVSRLAPPDAGKAGWLFKLVFDYGEHDGAKPTPQDQGKWLCRNDPFSTYRSGFEIRTYRLCQRILMFHDFPGEPGVGKDCLVRSMRLSYRNSRRVASDVVRGDPAGALLATVTVTGHRRFGDRYDSRSLPPLELTYSTASPDGTVHELDSESLENLPIGVDGNGYQWADLDGESISGALTTQAGAWYYKANAGGGRLGAVQVLPVQPSLPLRDGQLLDLAGDGQLDLVDFGGPIPGFFERTDDRGWAPHRPFTSLPNLDWADPNLRFGDLNGDGHADVLITEADAIVWHRSLGETGFGPAQWVTTAADDDTGPRLLFADGTQSIYLADFVGDGLPDLVRVRNGEVCYWPNLGYGRFGPKVVMDNSPQFDHPDRFDQRRLRLADVDGSGPTDLIYLGAHGVALYTNLMGNTWSAATRLPAFPTVDNLATVSVVDLLGHGTACLVWSSPLPADAGRQVRYVDLMGTKPHLLVHVANNLGAETAVSYATSTSFYLRDKAEGRPWVTRLPFPVHVVEKVETFDRVSRNRFVTRYRYRDGYFDGHDREFRGFAMVEQEDTEHIAALARSETFPAGDNVDPAHHLPPVRTRTWFHTGAFLGRDRLSRLFAGQYYPPPEHAVPEALAWLLADTPLPPDLPEAAEREACRALKGQMLRQEVYALDGTDLEPHPYTVVERNYTIRAIQPPLGSRHGVFAVDPRETITATCERNPQDARVAHEIVLDVDPFGTVLHSVAIAYGRGTADSTLPQRTRTVQATTLISETKTEVTNPVVLPPPGTPLGADAYRVPVPYDTSTWQLSGTDTTHAVNLDRARARLDRGYLATVLGGALPAGLTRRLVARQRVRFQANELTGPLNWGVQQPRGLTHETYRLALTDGIRQATFGTRVDATMLTAAGYITADGSWWIPSGTVRYTPPTATGAPADYARRHFFLPRRFVDPFAAVNPAGEYATTVEYDEHDLLPVETIDPTGNTVTAGERNSDGSRAGLRIDYRVLAPTLVTDPNRNRVAVTFDALGLVTATAVMGKSEDDTGDRVDTTATDVSATDLAAFWADPYGQAPALLGKATTRMVYDLNAYHDSKALTQPQPTGVATIARQRHVADPATTGSSPQITFGYSDGTGQQIQQKLPAEPDPDLSGPDSAKPPRWVGSGWTVLNNKGKPVRQYEPFFTPRHIFEFAVKNGVSPVLCYDPPGRAVATLHPNHTYDKVVIGPWHQHTWDVNDTTALPAPDGTPAGNPADDADVRHYLEALPETDYLPTWYRARITGALGNPEKDAAERTELHTETPLFTCLDPLGRPVLTIAHNRTPTAMGAPVNTMHRTYSILDITGNQLEIADCMDVTPGPTTGTADRLVTRDHYDLAGSRLHAESMEAGTRRQLADIMGNPVAVWEVVDTAGTERTVATRYDRLRRPVDVTLRQGTDTKTVQRATYGEAAVGAELANLRGRIMRSDDGAGALIHTYDVQGNLTSTTRTVTAATSYRDTVNWATGPPMDTVARTGHTAFDALNRPHEHTHPDGSVVRYAYNQAGLLEEIDATLALTGSNTTFIGNIDYNAKGQRTHVAYGNGVTTDYSYDRDTFRLTTLRTRRGPASPDDPIPPDTRRGVQNLAYTYDPAGNITHIHDTAQPRVFNLNTIVDAGNDFTYDALYRLIEAHGREHLGMNNGTLARPTPTSATDIPWVNPTDRNALGRYHERYAYDFAGNLTTLEHRGTDPTQPGWTRAFTCSEPSQLEPSNYSNQLTSTSTKHATTTGELYHHDVHGNMDLLPPLQLIRWDHRNQLHATTTQSVGPGLVPETTYYCYDSAGQRVRWVRDSQAPNLEAARPVEERIYLGDFELYRTYDGNGQITLERNTIHIMDGQQRVALIETRTDPAAPNDPNRQLIRYQHINHLGSATVELDDTGGFISYEEYHPYGSTALVFWRAGTPPKRYRYTGKERDATGLHYHGARYYAPWLLRWTSPDPTQLADGLNIYKYASTNPQRFVDSRGTQSEPSSATQQIDARFQFLKNQFEYRAVAAGAQLPTFPEKDYAPSTVKTAAERRTVPAPFVSDLDRERIRESNRAALQWRAAAVLGAIGISVIVPEVVGLLGLKGTTAGAVVTAAAEVGSATASDYGQHGDVDPTRVSSSVVVGITLKSFLRTMPNELSNARTANDLSAKVEDYLSGEYVRATPDQAARLEQSIARARARVSVAREGAKGVDLHGMAVSREHALTRMQGKAIEVDAHIDEIYQNMYSRDVPHWESEISGLVNQIESDIPSVGQKTGAEWTVRINSWRARVAELSAQRELAARIATQREP